MRSGRVARKIGVAVVCLALLAPLGLAESLELYPNPATEEAREIKTLFDIVMWLAIVIFVFVEGLLLYVIWRFRRNKNVPKGETHRGHTTAEILWSVGPALILIFIGGLSVQTLEQLDKIPESPDFRVTVIASQFAWDFEYIDPATGKPDATARSVPGELHVESGRRVVMDIVAQDVIHAVWIPAFGIKLDAVPGRTNQQWFDAPAPGEYFLQCAEYCGVGHHAMRAKVVVFPKDSRPQMYGAPPEEKKDYSQIPQDVVSDMRLLETGGNPFDINPRTLTVKQGQGVWMNVINEGRGLHNLYVPAFGEKTRDMRGGENETIAFVADKTGSFEYYCAIPGHKEIGMKGTLVVEA